MRDVSEHPGFAVRIWEKGEEIDLRLHGALQELRPIEFHVKMDGAITSDGGDGPSFCLVLVGADSRSYFAQVSEGMFTPALAALGYTKESSDGQA